MKIDIEKVVKENFAFRRFDIFQNMARSSSIRICNRKIFIPYKADSFEWYLDYVTPNAFEMIHAYQDAELFSNAVCDESVPAFCNYAGLFGRVRIIHLLGLIGYKPASLRIREAMMHDSDAIVRSQSAESLGKLGMKRYVPDLIHTLREDKDVCVRKDACRALGLLGDFRDLSALREFFEESRADVYQKGFQSWGWDGIIESLKAMLMIGGELAQKTFEEAYYDNNPLHDSYIHVPQAALRGKYWAEVCKGKSS